MGMYIKRLSAVAFIFIALLTLLVVQSSPSFLQLFPMLILLLVVSWYLYKEIQRDNEESLRLGMRYLREEQKAQVRLHKSFSPRMKKLAEKEMQIIIIASGVLLMSFIFLWSYFIEGFFTAVISTVIGLVFFVAFIMYSFYTPKEFTHIFKHVPKKYRHHSKNNWIHAYILLFPFAIIGFFLYSLTTEEGIIESLFWTIMFLIAYTFIFISIYCGWFLYKEYQKEQEESLKKPREK